MKPGTSNLDEMEQIRKEEEYVQNLKGMYKLLALAILSLLAPFILALNDSSFWTVFLWILLSWAVILGIYSLNIFDFFGEKWKKKVINKKFKK